jgi:hypothetical protein
LGDGQEKRREFGTQIHADLQDFLCVRKGKRENGENGKAKRRLKISTGT